MLIDSWYTNLQIWNKCIEKKYHLIGAMKSNRILYPDGMRISASDYAATLTQDQFHLVIDRFLIILTVAWFFLTCKNGVFLPLYGESVPIGAFWLFCKFAHLEVANLR